MVKKSAGLEVLKELGLLALSPQSIEHEASYSGRHRLPERHPLYDYTPLFTQKPFGKDKAAFLWKTFPAGASPAEVREATRLFVFIGCADSPELQERLNDPDCLKIICEPSVERLAAYVEAKGPRSFIKRNILFFGGDPDRFTPSMPIMPEIFRFGFPAVFAEIGLFRDCPDLVEDYARRIEILHYRTIIYPVESQNLRNSLPLRPMRRDAIYDRIAHLYENVLTSARLAGSLNDLKGALAGETAILVAAGPALDGKIDWIKANRNRAAVIAVNNAMRTLLANGLEPDFCIINDTSVEAGKAFDGLPRLQKCRLVAHCLSKAPGSVFPAIYFFGNVEGQLSVERDSLLLHGSVITTAFSLAEYLGCERVVLTGAQLASDNPNALSYSPSSIHGRRPEPVNKTKRKSLLIPTAAADGSVMFSTPNFLDVSYWFLGRIRTSKLEVVQTEPHSIIYGDPIVIDPDPQLPEAPNLAQLLLNIPWKKQYLSRAVIKDWIGREMDKWREVRKLAQDYLLLLAANPAAPDVLEQGARIVQQFDNDNTSFMLQRYHTFSNNRFHNPFFSGDDRRRRAALQYYFSYLGPMADELFNILLKQFKAVDDLPPA
jgi:hypothetical protein